jgi:hypothetical protein
MDNRKLLLIEMKKAAGLATPDEIAVYENTPVIAGNGLVTYHSADPASWLRRWEGVLVGPHALSPDPGAIREPS